MTQITEWLITSSTLIVLVLILRTLFAGKVSRRGLYLLWALVAVRLLLPVNLFSSPMSIMNLFSTPQTAAGETEIKQEAASPAMEPEENALTDDVSVITKSEAGNPEYQQPSDTASNAEADTIPETTIQKPVKTGITLSRTLILFIVWSVGFVSVLLLFTVCNITLRRRLVQNRKYVETFKGLRIYSSTVFQIPCLHGLFRPTIYLPEGMVTNDGNTLSTLEIVCREEDDISKSNTYAQRINQVLTHEWVHYRQGDSFWSVLRIFLLAAYWFHPLVWAAAVCSKKDAELACDEKVLQLLGEQERISYGNMLIDMAANPGNRMSLYLTTPVSRQGKSLKQRIHALEKRSYSKVMSCTLIISVLLMTSTTFTGCVPGAGRQGSENTPASLKNTETNMGISQRELENLYTDFLKEHQSEKEFSYYSFINLGDTSCPVLLTTDKTMEKDYLVGHSSALVANTSHLYSIIEKKVTYLGDITCENTDDWLHCFDGKLMLNSPFVISKHWVEAGEREIQTKAMSLYSELPAEAEAEGKETQTKTQNNESDGIGRGGAVGTPANSSSDGSFDGEAETPATSTDIPHTEGRVYAEPDNIISYYVDPVEPETPATSADDTSDEENSDTVVIDSRTQEDDYWVWCADFDDSNSVIFYRNTEDTLTEFASQNYLMHMIGEGMVELVTDITGDGINDTISIDVNAAKGYYQTDEEEDMPSTIQVISGKTNKVIWENDANASLHAGYNQFYLYRKKNTYLMEWNPACWQGYCSYQWKVFKLTNDGKVKKIAGNKVEFDTNEGRVDEKDFDKIEAFGKELNTYLANAQLLLDTVPEETLGIPEDGTTNKPIRVYGSEQKGESYFDYEAVIRELKATLNK